MAPPSISPFLDRLALPQPALQRAAVRSIFAHYKKAPSHEQPNSALGREALTLCLTHQSHAVVDESAQQLVRLVSERPDLQDSGQAVEALLEGLREVSLGGVGPLVSALGAILRNSLNGQWKKDKWQAPTLHSPRNDGRTSELLTAGSLSEFSFFSAPSKGAVSDQGARSQGGVLPESKASQSLTADSKSSGELHPFQRAILLSGECQEPVLRQVAILLTQSVETGACREMLLHLRPFITFAFLEKGAFLGRRLVGTLVGIAASCGPELAGLILELLTWHVGLLRLGGGNLHQGTLLAALTEDLTSLIQVLLEKTQQEESEQSSTTSDLEQGFPGGVKIVTIRLVGTLVGTCFEAQRSGLSALPILQATGRLAALLPAEFSHRLLPALAWLLSAAQIEQEQLSILRLISMALDSEVNEKPASSEEGAHSQMYEESLVAMTVLPVIQLLALPSGLLRNAAIGALNKVEQICSKGGIKVRPVAADVRDGGNQARQRDQQGGAFAEELSSGFWGFWLISGEAKLAMSIESLVTNLWKGAHNQNQGEEPNSFSSLPLSASPKVEALDGTVAWLAALGAHLKTVPPRKQGSKSAQESKSKCSGDLVRIAFFVAGALMMHPDGRVRVESARVLGFAARLDPVQAVPLLPAVLWWLRREETLVRLPLGVDF
jgi:hypothetical protein